MNESPTDVPGRIFISYRRDDTAYPAGWLYDRLAERFGEEQIFKDVDSIELGEDFVEEIGEAVGAADVLLAVIGDRWLTVTDEQGNRRLDDPDDFVRLEIEAALGREVRVIPILVEGASMPDEDELPPSLTPLARRQALELSPSSFAADSGKLLRALEEALAEEQGDLIEPPGWRQRLAGHRLLAAVVGAAVLLALVIGGVVLFSGSDDNQTPPDEPSGQTGPVNGSIAFVSDRSGANEIWTLPPDQSAPTQLTFGFAEASRPDWSPDGKRVVFASDRGNEDGDTDLWILNTMDESEMRLTGGPGLDDLPDWSPDGREIAFGRADPGSNLDDIFIVDVETEEVRRVTDDPADDDAPDWSTTGRIAFESDREGDFEIYTLDPSGLERDVQRVTSAAGGDFSPSWSPDGRLIAYFHLSNGGPESDLYTIRADGAGQPSRLTSNGAINRRPSWSPDGAFIAFDSSDGGPFELFRIPSDGGTPRELVSEPGSNQEPSWGAQPE